MRLWLVRHARPLIGQGICYGSLEVLADEEETRAAAIRLSHELPSGVEVLTSPRQRCTQLAHALSELRPDLVPRTEPRLAEMDFGNWEGRAWDSLRQELDQWAGDFGTYSTGGTGESAGQFVRRVGALLDETLASGRDQVWIAHAGVYKAVLMRRSGVEPLRPSDWPKQGLAMGAWEVFDLGT